MYLRCYITLNCSLAKNVLGIGNQTALLYSTLLYVGIKKKKKKKKKI